MNNLKISSLNIKPRTTDKHRLLAEMATDLGIDVATLQETRRGVTHEENAGNAFDLWCTKDIWCTKDDGTPTSGVGFLVPKETKIEPHTSKHQSATTVSVPQHPSAKR